MMLPFEPSTPAAPTSWPLHAIWQAVAPSLPGFKAEALPSVDSSNTELIRRFRQTALGNVPPVPTLLVAEQQTAGRGRLGRSWFSQPGSSLTFSLGLALQPADWSGLSLVVGISLADSLEPASAHGATSGLARRIALKWPNDLWLADANPPRSGGYAARPRYSKLAGILVETLSLGGIRYAVIGVGINICTLALPKDAATDDASAPPAFAPIAPGNLQSLWPGLDAAGTLLRVVAPLVQALLAFEQLGFAPFQARFAQRDALCGRAVSLSDGSVGTAHGVGENGALLVHTPMAMREITSLEVSVRPC